MSLVRTECCIVSAMTRGWGFLLVLLSMLSSFSVAEAASSTQVSIEPARVEAGQRAVISVQVHGVSQLADSPRIPPVKNLVIRGGGQQTNISMVNGKMSRSITYTFVVETQRPGTYSIGPIEVILSPNNIERAAPVQLEVLAPPTRASSGSGQVPDASRPESAEDGLIFVKTVVNDKRIYFGEQIILKMQFYQARGLRVLETRLESPPETTGFLREELPPQRTRTETIDGRSYSVTELAYALFPTQTGELTIGSAVLECSVEDRRRQKRRRGIFDGFGMFNSKRVILRSQPIKVQVDRLPQPSPTDFTGAVGSFRLKSSVDRTEVGQNEPLTLSVILEGTGNIASVGEPALPEIPGFRTFAASVADLSTRKAKDRISGKKEFEIVLIPETTGTLIIPPVEMSIFRPRSATYATLRTDSLAITVVPGSSGNMAGGEVERVGRDLRNVRPETTLVSQTGWRWNSPKGWALAMSPLLLLAGGAWVRQKKGYELSNSDALRRRRADGVYQAGLKSLRREDAEAHRKLDELFSQYLQDRFAFAVLSRSREDLLEMLGAAGTKDETLELVQRLLSELDFARFASQAGGSLSETTLQEAADLVAKIETETKSNSEVHPNSPGAKAHAGTLTSWILLLLAISLPHLAFGSELSGAPEERSFGLSTEAAAKTFDRAVLSYQNQEFVQAREEFRQLVYAGYSSPELWLNLGNAHYRLGERGWAVYAFERGRRERPKDPDLRANLQLATVDLPVTGDESRLLTLGVTWLDRSSLGQSLAVVVGLCWILALGWLLKGFSPHSRLLSRLGVGGSIALALACVWAGAEAIREQGRTDSVAVEEVHVRSNPDPNSTVEFTLPPGTEIRTGRVTADFTEVLFSAELQGWASRERIISLTGNFTTSFLPADDSD